MYKSQAQAFPTSVKASCDIYRCYKPAAYMIGRPDGPRELCLNVCEGHFRELQDSMAPDPVVVLEGDILERLDTIEETSQGWHRFPDGEAFRVVGRDNAAQTFLDKMQDVLVPEMLEELEMLEEEEVEVALDDD